MRSDAEVLQSDRIVQEVCHLLDEDSRTVFLCPEFCVLSEVDTM